MNSTANDSATLKDTPLKENLSALNWQKVDGLLPAIIQDSKTNQVLMLGYLNEASLAQTQATGKVTFFSRTRQAIWVKGESSGNYFAVDEIKADCDQDTLLIRVTPHGPACHRNTTTCFDQEPPIPSELAFSAPSPTPKNSGEVGIPFLAELEKIIQDRIIHPSAHSYTSNLLEEGLDRIIQKVGEEAIETVIAAKNEKVEPLESEAADLIFHLMVLLQARNTSLTRVASVLNSRHNQVTK